MEIWSELGEEDRRRRDVLLLLCVIIQIMLREATMSVPEEPGSRALAGDGGGNQSHGTSEMILVLHTHLVLHAGEQASG